jgi:DNA (cytosine-5)-methyltransferase 1
MHSEGALTLSRQYDILRNCVANNLDLEDELRRLDYTFDALHYRYNGGIQKSSAMYAQADALSCKKNNIPMVSFFSGCGGADIGFEYAGFEHVASFEVNGLFCETLRKNRPSWKVFGPPHDSGDLKKREATIASLEQIGVSEYFEGVFHGGPPCQSFSIAANQRFAKSGDNFKRVGFEHGDYGNLLFDFIHYVVAFKPRVFLIENVPGLASIDGGKQLALALEILARNGYVVNEPWFLDAAMYGVPQHRRRLIICGSRGKRQVMCPEPDMVEVPCYKALEKSLDGIENHETRKHRAASVLRYMELKYGQRDHLGRVDRLDPDCASKTVIAGGTAGGGRSHLHPFVPRTLSVRESARLQTFPDGFVFTGPPARQFTQVGNAVPPVLALKIARAIYCSIYA